MSEVVNNQQEVLETSKLTDSKDVGVDEAANSLEDPKNKEFDEASKDFTKFISFINNKENGDFLKNNLATIMKKVIDIENNYENEKGWNDRIVKEEIIPITKERLNANGTNLADIENVIIQNYEDKDINNFRISENLKKELMSGDIIIKDPNIKTPLNPIYRKNENKENSLSPDYICLNFSGSDAYDIKELQSKYKWHTITNEDLQK